jgi:hypothetical protein
MREASARRTMRFRVVTRSVRFEVAPFTVMVAESPATKGVSAGLVPTGPATGRLPKPVRQTAALRPACPDGSNDWCASQPNNRGFRPGKPDGERLNTEVLLVANQLLIPPGQARLKSTPICSTSKGTREGCLNREFFGAPALADDSGYKVRRAPAPRVDRGTHPSPVVISWRSLVADRMAGPALRVESSFPLRIIGD